MMQGLCGLEVRYLVTAGAGAEVATGWGDELSLVQTCCVPNEREGGSVHEERGTLKGAQPDLPTVESNLQKVWAS